MARGEEDGQHPAHQLDAWDRSGGLAHLRAWEKVLEADLARVDHGLLDGSSQNPGPSLGSVPVIRRAARSSSRSFSKWVI
jgi:hypothetical protein